MAGFGGWMCAFGCACARGIHPASASLTGVSVEGDAGLGGAGELRRRKLLYMWEAFTNTATSTSVVRGGSDCSASTSFVLASTGSSSLHMIAESQRR
ncbi:hypothetical protein EJ06DRAFT_208204 [Trichodelitschia bisporula]|uniref:Secreted protein n=1 Tax=Trichodelitschia bisporula TaxID=703511 RepID=A0A6G1I8M7_9PEZI|nr:hypothetical protein EJ06DRAFT_208204 [Trichodelitschia bisporula]